MERHNSRSYRLATSAQNAKMTLTRPPPQLTLFAALSPGERAAIPQARESRVTLRQAQGHPERRRGVRGLGLGFQGKKAGLPPGTFFAAAMNRDTKARPRPVAARCGLGLQVALW
jgi:hypothetical protein